VLIPGHRHVHVTSHSGPRGDAERQWSITFCRMNFLTVTSALNGARPSIGVASFSNVSPNLSISRKLAFPSLLFSPSLSLSVPYSSEVEQIFEFRDVYTALEAERERERERERALRDSRATCTRIASRYNFAGKGKKKKKGKSLAL